MKTAHCEWAEMAGDGEGCSRNLEKDQADQPQADEMVDVVRVDGRGQNTYSLCGGCYEALRAQYDAGDAAPGEFPEWEADDAMDADLLREERRPDREEDRAPDTLCCECGELIEGWHGSPAELPVCWNCRPSW